MKLKGILFLSLFLLTEVSLAQAKSADHITAYPDSLTTLVAREENEKLFSKYMVARHGGPEALAEFKKKDSVSYYNELWYYSHSFYIKKNHFESGSSLRKSTFCITRYESYRKPDEESIVTVKGFRDVLVLLPGNKLRYKP